MTGNKGPTAQEPGEQFGNTMELTRQVLEKIRLWEETSKQYTGILAACKQQPELLRRLVRLYDQSARSLDELQQKITDFYVRAIVQEPAVGDTGSLFPEKVRRAAAEFLDRLRKTGPYCQPGELGPMLEEVRIQFKLDADTLHSPLRKALAGEDDGAAVKEVLAVLGIDRVINRLSRILEV